MKKIRYIYIIGVICSFSIVLFSCKPTEKNYKAAYDAAKQKREVDMADRGKRGVKVEQIDAPRIIKIDGMEIGVKTLFLTAVDNADFKQPLYSVVVGRYKMPTNARGQVETLKQAGFRNALLMKDRDGQYLVVVATSNSKEEGMSEILRFRKNYPDYPYIGLYGDILIVEKP